MKQHNNRRYLGVPSIIVGVGLRKVSNQRIWVLTGISPRWELGERRPKKFVIDTQHRQELMAKPEQLISRYVRSGVGHLKVEFIATHAGADQ